MAELNLNPELNDLFIELATMGLGRAASAMSALAEREVKISAPSMEVFSIQNRTVCLSIEAGPTLRVSQAIKGGLHGQAVVVLSKAGATRIAQLLLEKTDESGDAFDETDQAAIIELGNIMIGSIVGTLANHFKASISYDIPKLDLCGSTAVGELISDLVSPNCSELLVLRSTLSINDSNIQSYFLLLLEDNCLQSLSEKLEVILRGTP